MFARSMVFLLDRSGSMAGEPLNAAKRALEMGLSLLQPQDCFAVVAFDHEQIWWKPSEWRVAGRWGMDGHAHPVCHTPTADTVPPHNACHHGCVPFPFYTDTAALGGTCCVPF